MPPPPPLWPLPTSHILTSHHARVLCALVTLARCAVRTYPRPTRREQHLKDTCSRAHHISNLHSVVVSASARHTPATTNPTHSHNHVAVPEHAGPHAGACSRPAPQPRTHMHRGHACSAGGAQEGSYGREAARGGQTLRAKRAAHARSGSAHGGAQPLCVVMRHAGQPRNAASQSLSHLRGVAASWPQNARVVAAKVLLCPSTTI